MEVKIEKFRITERKRAGRKRWKYACQHLMSNGEWGPWVDISRSSFLTLQRKGAQFIETDI